MLKNVPIALGVGAVSALLYLSVLMGTPGALILAYLSMLPIFLIGLGLNALAAGLAAIAGAVITAAVGGLLAGAMYAAMNAAPAAWICHLALLGRSDGRGDTEWYPLGRLLTWLAGLAAAGFLFAMALGMGFEGGMQGQLERLLDDLLRQFMESRAAPGETPPELPSLAAWAAFIPAVFGLWWILMMAINGALAQGLLVRLGRQRRPTPKLTTLELPPRLLYALVAALVLAFLPGDAGYVGQTLAALLAVPYLFLGLAVMHMLIRRMPGAPVVFVVFYVFMLIFGWPLFLITGLGLVEQWAGLRRRLGDDDKGQEVE
jgi:hypothetical protein